MHLFIQYLRTGIIRIYSMNSEIMSLLGISKVSLEEARLVVNKSPLVLRTPLPKNVGENFGLELDDLNICQVQIIAKNWLGVVGEVCCQEWHVCDGVSKSRGTAEVST